MFRGLIFSLFLLCTLIRSAFAESSGGIEIPEILVDAMLMESQEIQPHLQLPGIVEPLYHGELMTEVEGIVTRRQKNLGDTVKKDDPILYVKNSQIGYNFKEYAVRAPVSGLVTELSVTVGQYVRPGQSLGGVTNPKAMRIIAEVPAIHLPQLREKQQGRFEMGNLTADVEITGVARYVKPQTGTARIELEPRNFEGQLVSGSVGNLTIYLDTRKALAIPLPALVDIGEHVYVRKIIENKVQMQKVTLGPLVGSQRIVLEGLNEGDEIVVEATDHLKAGDPIKRSQPKPSETSKDEARR